MQLTNRERTILEQADNILQTHIGNEGHHNVNFFIVQRASVHLREVLDAGNAAQDGWDNEGGQNA